MTFEYLSESDQESTQKVALLGMGSLAKMKLVGADGGCRPPADELIDTFNDELPETDSTVQIPIED